MKTASLHRTVRITARTSAVLFTSAQIAQALRLPTPSAWRPLYVAFVAAHAIHFGFVARFAHRTHGRELFPGGRNMHDVGGWPTVLGIFTFFFVLAAVGWAAAEPADARLGRRLSGRVAMALIGAMFVSFYLGQVPRSPWHAVPGGIVGSAVLANIVGRHHHRPGDLTGHGRARRSSCGAGTSIAEASPRIRRTAPRLPRSRPTSRRSPHPPLHLPSAPGPSESPW